MIWSALNVKPPLGILDIGDDCASLTFARERLEHLVGNRSSTLPELEPCWLMAGAGAGAVNRWAAGAAVDVAILGTNGQGPKTPSPAAGNHPQRTV